MTYKNPVTIENEEGGVREVAQPYTNFKVKVIENLKGDLLLNNIIPIQKSGGLSEDGKEYILYEGDNLPIIGESYIIYAYAQPDGSLLVSGPLSNTLIKSSKLAKSSNVSQDTNEYQEALEAITNELVTNRKRFVSTYEE